VFAGKCLYDSFGTVAYNALKQNEDKMRRCGTGLLRKTPVGFGIFSLTCLGEPILDPRNTSACYDIYISLQEYILITRMLEMHAERG